MKQKTSVILLAILLFGSVGGFAVYKLMSPAKQVTPVKEEVQTESLPQVDSSVKIDLIKSKTKANTVVISVSGLGSNYRSVAYELTYQSQGLIKGVNSGSKPIDVTGKDSFERETYLGTCSKNDCRPDVGVTKVSLVLEFTKTDGKKSQFSKDYPL